MKKTGPLYALKRLWFLIILIVFLGTVVGACVLHSEQSYTASVSLLYRSPLTEEGSNPNNTELDFAEITSPGIIEKAVSGIDIGYSCEEIRSGLCIEPVVLTEGSVPTEYRVSLTLNTRQVSKILEMILDSYFEYYADHHVAVPSMPSSADKLSGEGISFIEFADLLSEYITDRIDSLGQFDLSRGEFRSSTVGYTFTEIANQYSLLRSTRLLNAYAYIIENNICANEPQLIEKYRFDIAENDKRIEKLNADCKDIQNIIAVYSKKNNENSKMFFNLNKTTKPSAFNVSTIIDNGLHDYEGFYATTYDGLLGMVFQRQTEIAQLQADTVFRRNIVTLLEKESEGKSDSSDLEKSESIAADASAELELLLDSIVGELKKLDETVQSMVKDYSAVNACIDIRQKNTAVVTEKYNMKQCLSRLALWLAVISVCVVIIMGFFNGLFKSDKNRGRHGRKNDDWIGAEEEEIDGDVLLKAEKPVKAEERPNEEYLSVLEAEQEEYDKFVRMLEADYLPVPYTVIGCRLIDADEIKFAMGNKKYERFIRNCVSCMESVAPKFAKVFLYDDDEVFCFMESGDKEEIDKIIDRFKRMIKYLSDLAKFKIDYSINTWGRLYTLKDITNEVSEKIESDEEAYSV